MPVVADKAEGGLRAVADRELCVQPALFKLLLLGLLQKLGFAAQLVDEFIHISPAFVVCKVQVLDKGVREGEFFSFPAKPDIYNSVLNFNNIASLNPVAHGLID